MKTTVRFALALIVALAFVPRAADAGPKKEAEAAEKRARIDAMAEEALAEVVAKADGAKALSAKAKGWAAFETTKVALGISGGGGSGVAISPSGDRTYMKMGTGGVGFGLGAQKSRVVFLFETAERFQQFLDGGWQGGAGASAAAGKEGANAAATFHDGVAVFVMTDKGLIANADVSGTKYWTADKLN